MQNPCFHKSPLLSQHNRNGTTFNIYRTNYINKILPKYSLALDSKATNISNTS